MNQQSLLFSGAMALLFSSVVGCTGPSADVSNPSESTTFSLSGALGLSTRSFSPDFEMNQDPTLKIFSVPDTSGLAATACSDGFYYQVYCLSFSETPVAKTGSVTCSGTTGSFTVADLPKNEGVGCFVRRSTDGSTYATLATVELPAATLTGSTSTIAAAGDLGVALTITPTGAVETAVTTGATNLTTTTPADVSTLKLTSGFYKLKCGSTSSEEFSLVACKCRNASMPATYQACGTKNPDSDTVTGGCQATYSSDTEACVADSAAEITVADTEQYIELNMYTGTPATAMNMGNGNVVPAGTAIPVISVWGASSSTVSSRGAGGEGAVTSIKDDGGTSVNLTWSSAQATNALAWAATDGLVVNGVTLNLATTNAAVAMPAFTATAGTWMTWVRRVMQDATGFTCNWTTPLGNDYDDAICISQFANDVFRRNRELNLPKLWVEVKCSHTGCDDTPANARINVDGVDFAYDTTTWSGSQAAATANYYAVAPLLKTRYVFEPFEATPDGGGGFHQGNGFHRGFRCDTSGADVNSALCDGTDNHDWLNCGVKEETSIRFVPTTTTGSFKVIFDTKETVYHASLDKFSGGTKTTVTTPAIQTLCATKLGTAENKFFMEAVKQ